MNISGVPDWLEDAVSRSLIAVWNEIPDMPDIDRTGTLSLVASRLFAGYEVAVSMGSNNEPDVKFLPHHDENIETEIEIKLVMPELRGMAFSWFEKDIQGMDTQIYDLVSPLPQSALTWSDEALKQAVGKIVNHNLPGWEFSQQIFISPKATSINITFRPGTPMILAVKPNFHSQSIPLMFRSDLEAKLLPEISNLIGVPVKWAEVHRQDIEKSAREFLEDRHSVENLRAGVNIDFMPGTVSNLEANIDSKNFVFNVWVAAYAGLEGRYPEAGAFFAYNPGWSFMLNPEIYAELILSLNDFDLTHRLGARFELLNNLWAGVEVQWPEHKYFLRAQYIPVKIRRPYFWWRWSPDLKAHEGALGYRVDEHVSIEIYYDSTGSDKLGLRGMWHL